jgi:chitobiase/beta-hexosaminidase-like protein
MKTFKRTQSESRLSLFLLVLLCALLCSINVFAQQQGASQDQLLPNNNSAATPNGLNGNNPPGSVFNGSTNSGGQYYRGEGAVYTNGTVAAPAANGGATTGLIYSGTQTATGITPTAGGAAAPGATTVWTNAVWTLNPNQLQAACAAILGAPTGGTNTTPVVTTTTTNAGPVFVCSGTAYPPYGVPTGSTSQAFIAFGNWSSQQGVAHNNYIGTAGTVDNSATSATDANGNQCMGCHFHTGSAATAGPVTLSSGHKNALRKVIPGQAWSGPDGNTYTTADTYYGSTATINWTNGTVNPGGNCGDSVLYGLGFAPGSCVPESGTSYPIYYILGGWVNYGGLGPTNPTGYGWDTGTQANAGTQNPQLNVAYQGGFIGEENGENGTWGCVRCHATGYNPVAANTLTGTTAGGTLNTYSGPEPTVPSAPTAIDSMTIGGTGDVTSYTFTPIPDANFSRIPTDQPSGTSSWYLSGVTCERCHWATRAVQTPGTNGTNVGGHELASGSASAPATNLGPNTYYPSGVFATSLCMECHRAENNVVAALPGSSISIPTGPVAMDKGYCSDLSGNPYSTCTATWNYVPYMKYEQGQGFLNSPHGQFNQSATISMNTQNSADLSLAPNVIAPVYVGSQALEAIDGAAAIGNYSSLFEFTTTSSATGSATGWNKGCTGCHDPHQTTVAVPNTPAVEPGELYSAGTNTTGAEIPNPAWGVQNPLGNTTNCNNSACHASIANSMTTSGNQTSGYVAYNDGSVNSVKHPTGPGTPFPTGSAADLPGACFTCHMQGASGVAQSHLFRINVNSNYYTYPPTAADFYTGGAGFTAAAGVPLQTPLAVQADQTYVSTPTTAANFGAVQPTTSFPKAAWNDVDIACGQCHGGGSGVSTVAQPNPNPYGIVAPTSPITPPVFSRAFLASAAVGIHPIGTVTAPPAISLAAGNYTASQTVTLTNAASSPSTTLIYYTTDGSIPTAPFPKDGSAANASSHLYTPGTTTITVSASETITAVSVGPFDYTTSVPVSAAYTIGTSATGAIAFAPVAGSYNGAQTVTLSYTTTPSNSDVICYTTNGTMPSVTQFGECGAGSSTYLGTAIPVPASETINAIAINNNGNGYNAVGTSSASYTITTSVAKPAFSLAAGTYIGTQSVTLSDTTAGAVICYSTTATAPSITPTSLALASPNQCASGTEFVSGTPISVASTETVTAIAGATNLANSSTASAAYTITTTIATPTFSPAAGAITTIPTPVTIADTTTGALICYNVGSAPAFNVAQTACTTGTQYTTPVLVSAAETLYAAAAVPNSGLTAASASAAYTLGTVGTPTFSPAAGTYTTAQTVTLEDATAGASVCYNIGSQPTLGAGNGACSGTKVAAGSTVTVSASGTLYAVAGYTGMTNSANATAAAYVITNATAVPTFSPAAGTINNPTNVVLLDSTANAIICYSEIGAPTITAGVCGGQTDAAKYTTAIPVSATTTIYAVAGTLSGTPANSANTTAVYTYAVATPAITPAAGAALNGANATLSDATQGATLCYTTSGTAPTWNGTACAVASGSVFTVSSTAPATPSVAIALAPPETIKAVAGSGVTSSAALSAAYTLTVAPPVFAITGGDGTGTTLTSTATGNVTITSATSGSSICYNVGSAAVVTALGAGCTTGTSALSPATITVATGETVYAIAYLATDTNSASANATYTVAVPTATPTFSTTSPSVAPGTYGAVQSVALLDATSGAVICYNINSAAAPTITAGVCGSGSSTYASPISVSSQGTTVIQAIAGVAANGANSMVLSGTYIINAPAAPYFNLPTGMYYQSEPVTLTAAAGVPIKYTTDGSDPRSSATATTVPAAAPALTTVALPTTYETTYDAVAGSNGLYSSIASATYNIVALNPVFPLNSGTFQATQTVSLTDNVQSPGAIICYAINGTPSVTNASLALATGNGTNAGKCAVGIQYISGTPISVASTETITAIAVYGENAANTVSSVSSGVTDSYTISPLPAVPPTFSEAAGPYTGTQSITLQTSSGSLICWAAVAAPGTPPPALTITAGGACSGGVSTEPVVVSASETVYAIAGGVGYTNSAVSSAAYTISGGGGSLGAALTPTFSLTTTGGTTTLPASEYTTLTSSNNALICAIAGGTPNITAGVCSAVGGIGTVYSGVSPLAIDVTVSETIKAIAGADAAIVGSSYTNSAPSQEIYVIE